MTYTSPLRRRARAARRIIVASAHRNVRRNGVVIAAYWWDGHPNFGDDLTPWLLPKYGVVPIHRVASAASFAGAGSVLEFLPPTFDGAIWGSGLMHSRPHSLPNARVLAVRGAHTRDLIGAPSDVALGDPGILASRHIRRPQTRWEIGLVPHGHHRGHEGLRRLVAAAGHRVHVINVHQRAAAALREIAACGRIISTSLHGLITADSFGIPAAWTSLQPPLDGGVFKFADYESVVTPGSSRFVPYEDGVRLEDLVSLTRVADLDAVRGSMDALESSLTDMLDDGDGLSPFPAGLVGVVRS